MQVNTTELAKTLRRNQTKAKAILWSRLRNRQLEGRKFRRQFPIGKYMADFACIEAKLVIELDGGQHADVEAYDARRTSEFKACEFFVMRFWNADVLSDIEGVMATIHSVLEPDEYSR